jgi:hypothetical protein
MRPIRFYIKLSAIIISVIAIAGYAILESRYFLRRSNITVGSPMHGLTLTNPVLNIEGQAFNVADISVNGLPIFVDEKGFFSTPTILAPGYSVIEVALKNKFGKLEKQRLEVIYKPSNHIN